MKPIQLGFKAFDPHELLCHFVACKAGLYKRENLNVELIDITFSADDELPAYVLQASCGAALSSALRGSAQRIVFVATDKPMFWIYANQEINKLEKLTNTKIATFPANAPPHHLAKIVLGKAGINVEEQIRLLSTRDDTARFGLLKSAHVDAAVISSAIVPAKIERAGFRKLCFFGDEIRIPTTGLAVHQSYLDKEPLLMQTLVGIMKECLSIMHQDQEMLATVLEEYFDVDNAFKNAGAELYQQYYTQDGRTTGTIAQNAINSLCQSLSISTVPEWDKFYKFAI